jgi:hypothetical protein
VNLDQLNPKSEFLDSLRQSDDPGIPYTIIAGNTSIIKPANQETRSIILRLVNRWAKSAIEFPFWGEENDIACSVSSIKDIPPDRSPSPLIIEAACNHLDYFDNFDGLQALADAVFATGIHSRPGA